MARIYVNANLQETLPRKIKINLKVRTWLQSLDYEIIPFYSIWCKETNHLASQCTLKLILKCNICKNEVHEAKYYFSKKPSG